PERQREEADRPEIERGLVEVDDPTDAGQEPLPVLDPLAREEREAGLVLVRQRAAPDRQAEQHERRHEQQRDQRRRPTAAQITPARRARSAILRARVRCGMSIICPFQAKAPAPRRACSSKAAMRATASSASAFDGVNAALITSICPGWIEILPPKPIAPPSRPSRRRPSRSGMSVYTVSSASPPAAAAA